MLNLVFPRKISVQEADFDLSAEVAALQGNGTDAGAGIGAVVSFIGLVRDFNGPGSAGSVSEMTLEHYSGMTEKSLHKIVDEAGARWALQGVTVIHRVGRLLPREQIVLVAVASAHRGEAFSACAFIMDYLKTQAPFWKREVTPGGARWVDARETDDHACRRWDALPGHDAAIEV